MKIKTKLEDSVITILVTGGIATIVQMIISWTLFLTDIIQQNPSLFHTRLLTGRMEVSTFELAIGTVGTFVAGVAFSTLILLTLKITGSDHPVIKGGGVGIVNTMFQFYILARLFPEPRMIIPDALTIAQVYLVYMIWGIITAVLIRNYADIENLLWHQE